MERYERMVREALKAAGARYKSNNRHEKWELPDGRCVTLAATSSDADYWKIAWGEVRKLLGLPAGPEVRRQGGHGKRRYKPGIKRPVVAELSRGVSLAPTGVERVRAKLMQAVRFEPGMVCCPVDRRAVYGTVVTVWLNRLFGMGRCV